MRQHDPIEYGTCRHCGVEIARFVRADCKWAHVTATGFAYLTCHNKKPVTGAQVAEPVQ